MPERHTNARAARRGRQIYLAEKKHAALKRYAKERGLLLSAVLDEAVSSYMTRKRIQTEEAVA